MGNSRIATAIGVGTLLIGASSVFVELQNSLNRIWGIPKRSRTSGLWLFIRSRFLSLGLVFGVGFLLMVSLLVSTVLAALGTWIASYVGEWRLLLIVIDVTLSLLISMLLFALVYKYLPQEHLAWGGQVWGYSWDDSYFGTGTTYIRSRALNHSGDGGSGNAFNAFCTARRSCGACAMAML